MLHKLAFVKDLNTQTRITVFPTMNNIELESDTGSKAEESSYDSSDEEVSCYQPSWFRAYNYRLALEVIEKGIGLMEVNIIT